MVRKVKNQSKNSIKKKLSTAFFGLHLNTFKKVFDLY